MRSVLPLLASGDDVQLGGDLRAVQLRRGEAAEAEAVGGEQEDGGDGARPPTGEAGLRQARDGHGNQKQAANTIGIM